MPDVLLLALPTPLRRLFEYLPPPMPETVSTPIRWQPGQRLEVPFGSQKLVGILVRVCANPTHPPDKLRAALRLLDPNPLLDPDTLQLCQWAADYYHYPFGEVLHAALPVQLRKAVPFTPPQEKGWGHTIKGKGIPEQGLARRKKQQLLHQLLLLHGFVSDAQLKQQGITSAVAKALAADGLIERQNAPEFPARTTQPLLAEPAIALNSEQAAALQAISYHKFGGYLLEGTTGSGKTEVYLHAIARILEAGGQALVLVPEIGLTPQTVQRFRQRFQVQVVELHSNVAQQQRTHNWHHASSGRARIVIGTRLAVFTPMPDLGIIVLDEEHDLSFKQQDGLRYSARDLAAVRAHRKQIPLLLGSATPGLETLYNALNQRYHHLHLRHRAGGAQPPALHLLDMRKQSVHGGLAQTTIEAIGATLSRGEQVLVFINRRGFAPALLCQECGWTANCPACDARMTLHRLPHHLHCHHCDRQRPIPSSCPSCHHPELTALGQGTERCEDVLQQLFPTAEILRVDQDSMQRKHAMAELTTKLHSGTPCVLVGTQMLAKGHHFPKVTLAVLLDVDQGLFSGDFRGPERMGQQLTQVAGRAGRSDRPGTVLVQSYQPNHPLLQQLLQEGYGAFAQQLLRERQANRLPPYTYVALIRAESKRAENALHFLQMVRQEAQKLSPATPERQYLGPMPALLERRDERLRFQLQLTFDLRSDLQHLLKQLLPQIEQHALARRTRWSIDVDPQDMG